MTYVLCPECGDVYTSEDSPSCPHDERGAVVTIRLQERDINGHGKRRRKRPPSVLQVKRNVAAWDHVSGETRHSSVRNGGRKPRRKW